MVDSEDSPLPTAQRSKSGACSPEESLESTPLLSGVDATPHYDGDYNQAVIPAASVASRCTPRTPSVLSAGSRQRWPSVIAMAVLALLSLAVIVIAFFVPVAVEEYAKTAAVVERISLALESITARGVSVRVEANFRVDGKRVRNAHIRRIGKFTTWMAGELRTGPTSITVRLPEHDYVLLGTAIIPPLQLSIADGYSTALDFVTELAPGSLQGIGTVANGFLSGRLHSLRVQAKADISVKSGIVPLGTHSVVESVVLEAKNLPQVPEHNITRLNFREGTAPGNGKKVMAIEASVSTFNPYPIALDVPELEFEVLVSGCNLRDPCIVVAYAANSPTVVSPQSAVVAEFRGLVMDIPESLTTVCPESKLSPLDLLLRRYLAGDATTVFVRGKKRLDLNTPDWLADLMSTVTVPVPFPGGSFSGMIRNFSMTDVHFTMPDPMSEPGQHGSDLKVSGAIQVVAALPSGMNLDFNVTNIRATADVLYKAKKLGELYIQPWQTANSTRLNITQGHEGGLQIQSRISDAPLNVTDPDVLTDVIQTLLFGGKKVLLDIKALVDVKVDTVLGPLVLKDLPAGGKIPVKPLRLDPILGLQPKIGNLDVVDTTASSITLETRVNITNPTPYTAHIPAISVHVLCNDTIIGEAIAEGLDIVGGNNTDLLVRLRWDPSRGDELGLKIGRDFLSQYLSGFNTSVTLRTHRDTIPSQPLIGDALSRFNLTVRTPGLSLPGADGGERMHFIRDATFHVISSTATFTLVSPLRRNNLYVEHINATAYYNHTELVGRVKYNIPFAVPPGASQTPKLPVDWTLDSIGYDQVRKALGGQLKLDAMAMVGVRLGAWTETVWYIGEGIGASIRI